LGTRSSSGAVTGGKRRVNYSNLRGSRRAPELREGIYGKITERND
jgi:hypothetical protein